LEHTITQLHAIISELKTENAELKKRLEQSQQHDNVEVVGQRWQHPASTTTPSTTEITLSLTNDRIPQPPQPPPQQQSNEANASSSFSQQPPPRRRSLFSFLSTIWSAIMGYD
jgi:hypothetical protein